MLRSMFAGVSGLRSHQTMMDVTGNNIANVNTFGYKSQRAIFQDALYQVVRGGTGGVNAASGGVNPMQIGLGARMASIDGVFSQGALQLTNRATDVAIQGEGYFVVSEAGQTRYTRAGTFNFDNAGNLVATNGEIVQGWTAAISDGDGDGIVDAGYTAPAPAAGTQGNIAIDPALFASLRDISVNNNGEVVGRDAAGSEYVLATLALATFPNQGGLDRIGSTMFSQSAASGGAQIGTARTGSRGAVSGGTLEMSNVDLAQEFTQLIMSQRGFQANARTITASDELLQELVNIKR